MNRWNRGLALGVGVLGFAFTIAYTGKEAVTVTTDNLVERKETYRVMLDPGHGGEDPGKVGINDAKEKDVNLEIASRVSEYLRLNDVQVEMTRTKDTGAGGETERVKAGSSKKAKDMKKRVEIIEASGADAAVSIHQNSYPGESICGAQVFYYQNSVPGMELAESVQDSIQERVAVKKERKIKGNDSYYLLKKVSVPTIIVECGFLSNQEEAAKLCDSQYQDRMAWAIAMGILRFLKTQ